MAKKKNIIQQGWECPKCGSVYAVWVGTCGICQGSKIQYRWSSSSTILDDNETHGGRAG